MHPTQKPTADSNHIKSRQVPQILSNTYDGAWKTNTAIIINVPINAPIPRAKRFYTAQTRSGS